MRWTAEAGLLLARAALGAVALGLVAEVLWGAYAHLGPNTRGLPLFNSDAAIPVLMANQAHWGLGDVYYAGQDRFGACPFWLAHLLGLALQRPVTPELLHALSFVFIASAVFPLLRLCPSAPGLAALSYALALLVPEVRTSVFHPQPYAWQLPALLWAWWSLREAWAAKAVGPRAGWLALATLLCFLATWTSPLSGPLLVALTVLEGYGTTAAAAEVHLWRRRLLLLLPAFLAVLGEIWLRRAYRSNVEARFHELSRTHLRLDVGYFTANLAALWRHLRTPEVLVALLVLLACGCLLLVRFGASGKARRFSPLECTLLGALLLAVLPLPVLVAVQHVRLNFYLDRYYVPTYAFAFFGALLALSAWLPSRLRGWPALAALAASTLALGLLAQRLRPMDGVDGRYARLQSLARRMAEQAPGAVVLDGYWGTYLFAALAPAGQLLPLPYTAEFDRMPAFAEALAGAPQVLVGHRTVLSAAERAEPRWLFQYGVLLVHEASNVLSDGVDAFSRYRPTAVQLLPFVAQPPLEKRRLWEGPLTTTLELQQPASGTAAVVELLCRALEPLPSAWAEGLGGERLAVEIRPVAGAVFFFLPEAPAAKALHLGFAPQPCQLREARWFVPPEGRR